jgi:hypothetical protein
MAAVAGGCGGLVGTPGSATYIYKTRLYLVIRFIRLCGSVGDPGSGAFLPPVSGMEQWSDPDPGSGISKQNLLIAFIQK